VCIGQPCTRKNIRTWCLRKEKETLKKSEGPKAQTHTEYVDKHILVNKAFPVGSLSHRNFSEQNPPRGERIELHHRIPDFRLVICDGSRSGRIVRRNHGRAKRNKIFRLRENPSLESIPGCFGFYEFPLAPNNCKTCRAAWLCKMCLPKSFREHLKKRDFEVIVIEQPTRSS